MGTRNEGPGRGPQRRPLKAQYREAAAKRVLLLLLLMLDTTLGRRASGMAAMASLCPTAVAAPRIGAPAIAPAPAPASARTLPSLAARPPRSLRLRAATRTGVEPDLEEDSRDRHQTAGEDMEDMFPYGEADGAHSWHEGQDGTWWEGIKEVFETSGGPVGAQGAISWLFIPGLIAGVYFNVDKDYLFLYTVLFIFAFIGMEMAKPSKPSHFEPDMYKLKK